MATFTGTASADIISPDFVSPGVIADGGNAPGGGRDTINGGEGDDTLVSGGGDDVVRGGNGLDVARLGSGNDVFFWSPGNGSDTVVGQDGFDTLDFSGANIEETIALTANGSRITFFRHIGNVNMDLLGMESMVFNAFGGADSITINPLTGTDAERVLINLESAAGSGVGDGFADTVRVLGTESGDKMTLTGAGTTAKISGLPYLVRVSILETNDSIQLVGNGGGDLLNAAGAAAGAHQIQLDGGDGSDTIIGSANADFIIGGDGRDLVRGNAGDDTALLGNADDVYTWKTGEGSDLIEGQQGEDTLDMSGVAAGETFQFAANGGRVSVFSSVDAAILDMDDIERVSLRLGAGADGLTIGDLTGTDLKHIDVNLAEKDGSGSSDVVTVSGTGLDDFIVLSLADGVISVGGLSTTVAVHHASAQDRLVIHGGVGADLLDASVLPAVKMQLDFRGSDGDDIMLGSGGDDRFIWNPGDDNDKMNGRGGKDLLDFFGAAASEVVNILANGQQLKLFRDVANVIATTNMVERFDFHAGGGTDTVNVGDLSGTSAQRITVDLAMTAGTGIGDAQTDTVLVTGRGSDDDIAVSGSASTIAIKGLPWQVNVEAGEAADLVVISTGAGDDTVDLTGLAAGAALRVDGGLGNDVLLAGSGADEFLFTTALDADANVDSIRRFSVADDLMLLGSGIFVGAGSPGVLAAGAFHVGTAATDAGHRIIYNDASGRLFFDSDGVGGTDAVLFAKLERGLALSAGDFVIV